MYVNKHVGACLSVLLAIVLAVGVAVVINVSQPGEADAQTVQGYSLVTLYDGGDAYTSTQYSNPILGGYFSHVQVQMATTAITSAHTLSITPQFSNETVVCGAITDWFDGALTDIYQAEAYTSVLTIGSASMLVRLEGAAPSAVGRNFPILGQCMRFKLESSASDVVYTPTLYARLIND